MYKDHKNGIYGQKTDREMQTMVARGKIENRK